MTQIILPSGKSVPIWSFMVQGQSLLIINQDPISTVYLGDNSGVQVGDSAASVVPPLGSLSIPASETWWAISDNTVNPITIQLIQGGADWTASPGSIAAALIASGFAVQLAQAIASGGISLLGSPALLYNGSIVGTGGTAGKFGVTISDGVPAQYGCSGTGASSFDCAYTNFNSLIAPNTTSRTKLFGTTSITEQVKWQSAIDQGHGMYCCYTPSTSLLSADLTAMENDLATIKAAATAAGTGAFIAGVIFYQEPMTKITAAQFQAVYNFYGPPIKALGYNIYANFQHGSPAVHTMNTYPLTSGGVAAITVDGIFGDFYATSWANNGTLLDSGDNGGAVFGGIHNNLVAIAAAMGKPWGLLEMGKESNNQTPPPLTGTNSLQGYLNYIQGVIQKVLTTAGATMLDVLWFNGKSGEPNVLLSGDPFIPLLKTFIGGILSAPPTGIAAGVTQVLPPLQPSPNAGYATANGISYDIVVNVVAGASSTRPFVTVILTWYNVDSPSAIAVATQEWTMPAGTSPGTIITGVGPQHGQFLKVSIFNDDTVSTQVTIQINSTSRPQIKHDWQWDVASSVAVPTFTLAGGSGPFSNDLCELNNVPVAASSSITRLCGMRAGEAYVRTNSAGGKVQFELVPVPNNIFGGSDSINVTPNAETTTIVDLPRGPMLWTFTNSDTVSHNVAVRITMKDT